MDSSDTRKAPKRRLGGAGSVFYHDDPTTCPTPLSIVMHDAEVVILMCGGHFHEDAQQALDAQKGTFLHKPDGPLVTTNDGSAGSCNVANANTASYGAKRAIEGGRS